MSTYLMNVLSCPCLSGSPRIITTILFKAYTYNWVILLIVLFDGIMLVQITWYIDGSITTIHVMSCQYQYQYCMSGVRITY